MAEPRRVAFLSMDSLEAFVCYDHLVEAPMADRGWAVDTVSWRDPDVDWDVYEAVVIRSTWDYQDDPRAFLDTLERIEASAAQLENPLDLVRWNLHKGYLRDMDRRGVPIVPTRFRAVGEALGLAALAAEWGVGELVVKPAVSANADHTYRWTPDRDEAELERLFQDRDALLQPFLPAIPAEGEFSLFYFGDTYSHAIRKAPADGDFRVQEEHGGQLFAVDPEPELLAAGAAALEAVRPRPLYARADFVRDTGLPGAVGEWLLIELELIEPSLYFPFDEGAAERFAGVFDAWMRGPSAEGPEPDGEDDAPEEPEDDPDAPDPGMDWIFS